MKGIKIIVLAIILCLGTVALKAQNNKLKETKNTLQMENITLVANITAKKGSEALMLKLLKKLVVESRKEEGCIRYDLHLDTENDHVFVIYEIWGSSEILEKHQGSEHFTNFKKKSENILESLDVAKLKKLSDKLLTK